MSENYQYNIKRSKKAIAKAESILIGAGAGLSESAGLAYSGKRFNDNFTDLIAEYGLTDMYSSGFYPFETQEEKWAYWSRHIKLNRYDPEAGTVYLDLYRMVKTKVFFVLTTNVDGQFFKARFPKDNVSAVQGDYGKFQCAAACHANLYDNEEPVKQMVKEQTNCKIPSKLVPMCPVCGGDMDPNLRKDGNFVEDATWHQSNSRYRTFVSNINDKKTVLLELGVGYNTPSIIKFPFEQITAECNNAILIRINKDYPEVSNVNKDKTIAFNEDISKIVSDLLSR